MSRLCNGVSGDQPYVRESRAYCEGRAFGYQGDATTYTSGVTGEEGDDNALEWTAAARGLRPTIALVDPEDTEQALAIVVAGETITVSLETDVNGDIATTAEDLITAIEADEDASALVTVADYGDSDGSGAVVEETVLLAASIVYATAATGDEQDDNALTWTAATGGNGLVVRLLDPGEADQALAVSVVGLQVDVSLATDQAGAIASRAADVAAAVAADNDAAALVVATDTGASAGTGVVEADEVRLTGGSYDAVQDSQDALCWERGFDSYNGGQGTLNAQDCCPYPSYTAVG
jgi:hypothetical protein